MKMGHPVLDRLVVEHSGRVMEPEFVFVSVLTDEDESRLFFVCEVSVELEESLMGVFVRDGAFDPVFSFGCCLECGWFGVFCLRDV